MLQLYTDVQKRGPKAYARLVDALVQSGNVTAAREDKMGIRPLFCNYQCADLIPVLPDGKI